MADDDLDALHETVEAGTFRDRPDTDAASAALEWLEAAQSAFARALGRPCEARPEAGASRSMIAAVAAARVRRRALASSDDATALAATARGGSLLERRVALARLTESARRDSGALDGVELPTAMHEPELERDILMLCSLQKGGPGREARSALAAVEALVERFGQALKSRLEGTSAGDPYDALSPDERAQLMLHCRALADSPCAFLCDRIAQLLHGGDCVEAIERIAALRPAADARALPVLAAALLDDPRAEVRAEAARSIARIDDPRVVALLGTTYARASDPGERIALAEALGMWGDFRGSDAVRDGLNDPREAVRIAALEALCDPALAESALALARPRELEPCRAALRAIGRAGDERALGWLEALADDAGRWPSALRAELSAARTAIAARAEMRGEVAADLLARAKSQASKQKSLSPPLSRKLGAPPTKRHRFAAWMLVLRAVLARVFGRREAASGLYERALDADPGWALPALLQATMWDRAGDGARAVAAYRRALGASPDRIATDVGKMTRIASAYLARVEDLVRAERVEAARALVDELSVHDLSALPSHVRLEVRRRRRQLVMTSLPEARGAA